MKQLHAIIHGRVQGVGFRDWTRQRAVQLGVRGWVKNRPDRTVELIAQADETTLQQFEVLLHKGPDISRVDRVTVTWSDAERTYPSFEITY